MRIAFQGNSRQMKSKRNVLSTQTSIFHRSRRSLKKSRLSPNPITKLTANNPMSLLWSKNQRSREYPFGTSSLSTPLIKRSNQSPREEVITIIRLSSTMRLKTLIGTAAKPTTIWTVNTTSTCKDITWLQLSPRRQPYRKPILIRIRFKPINRNPTITQINSTKQTALAIIMMKKYTLSNEG